MTTSEFDATDEAFFNAAYDDGPVSEAPVAFDVEAQEPEPDQSPAEALLSERLRARRTRLNQAVVEIVASLALVSSLAAGMHLVRSSAASSARIPSGSEGALPISERPERDSVTWRARPTAPDSAARLRSALRRFRPAAGDRVAPGS